MSRRQFLAATMLIIIAGGLFLIAKMFVSSLGPEANAKVSAVHQSNMAIDVSEIKNNEEKVFVVEGKPILIRKINENNYVVFLMWVRFSDKNVHGCGIQYVSPHKINYEDYPKNTAYSEQCRGVFFDSEGNVLPGSEPTALPIERLKWEWEFNEKRRIKIYT